MVHKAGANFPGIKQIVALVIPYDYAVKGIAGSVASDDQLLALVDLIFYPGSAALP